MIHIPKSDGFVLSKGNAAAATLHTLLKIAQAGLIDKFIHDFTDINTIRIDTAKMKTSCDEHTVLGILQC